MSKKKPREGIARTCTGETVILIPGFAAMLEHIRVHGSATYGSLEKVLHIKRQTLRVYAQRLEQNGLLLRDTAYTTGKPTTTLRLREGVQILANIRRVKP